MQRLFEGSIYLKFGRDFEDYIRAAVLTRGGAYYLFCPKFGKPLTGGGAHSSKYGIPPIEKKNSG